MQFAAGPTLGNLSDRFGRRPVLLLSLFALAVDYLIMGFAPALWLLFVGRALAGIAGATYATANAFIADISPPHQRAQNFGLLGAGFGVGLVAGPLIGGLAGELGTRAPFFAAAALAFANLAYGALVLPESLAPESRRRFDWRRANPLGAARQIAAMPAVAWLFLAMFLFDLAHHVYPAIWSFYAKEAFAWSNAEVGLSLAFVGVCFAVTQGWLIRFILPRLGEAGTAFWGLVVSIAGLVCFGVITQGWMVYVLIFLTALGAVVTPAMTGLMSSRVPGNAQGELQGGAGQRSGGGADHQPGDDDADVRLLHRCHRSDLPARRTLSRSRGADGPGTRAVLDGSAAHHAVAVNSLDLPRAPDRPAVQRLASSRVLRRGKNRHPEKSPRSPRSELEITTDASRSVVTRAISFRHGAFSETIVRLQRALTREIKKLPDIFHVKN